jgi:hypothetical protein
MQPRQRGANQRKLVGVAGLDGASLPRIRAAASGRPRSPSADGARPGPPGGKQSASRGRGHASRSRRRRPRPCRSGRTPRAPRALRAGRPCCIPARARPGRPTAGHGSDLPVPTRLRARIGSDPRGTRWPPADGVARSRPRAGVLRPLGRRVACCREGDDLSGVARRPRCGGGQTRVRDRQEAGADARSQGQRPSGQSHDEDPGRVVERAGTPGGTVAVAAL